MNTLPTDHADATGQRAYPLAYPRADTTHLKKELTIPHYGIIIFLTQLGRGSRGYHPR